MIPSLSSDSRAPSLVHDFVAELRLRGFEGDIADTHADRTVFATDNSIYQLQPQAIVFPRHDMDVVRIAKVAGNDRFKTLKLAPRGGGTGTNGQSLTEGICVDLSRHMNRILEINVAQGWARVQAGVVKDQLNAAIESAGLFFAPELSPSNRATIGGMIATDASGQGSVLYGKTRDHVLALNVVFMDGTEYTSRPLTPEQLAAAKGRADRVGHVLRVLDRIRQDSAELIAERFPKLNRCVTGYDLVHLCDCHGHFDLNAVLCGAEGTLAFVTEAKIKLTPVPRFSALLNIRYDSFDAALRDAGTLMKLQAASSETVDATVLGLARQDAIWLQVRDFFPDDPQGPAAGVNIVEFVAQEASHLEAQLEHVLAAMADGEEGRRGYTMTRDKSAIQAIWSMRKKAVGLLGNMKGERRPMPFVEDTVVPPQHLADYIHEFRALLDQHGLMYGMFGHVDAGCLHVRPALDLKDPVQERLVREISDQVYELTRKYNGVLWGEHGRGFRSEYAPQLFGPLYARMQEIKVAFDPHGQLNPGKIAAAPGTELRKLDSVPTRGQHDRQIPIQVRAANEDLMHCNGNAACFNFDPDDPMCPSWKATRDRRHSPKGRASLMREWLRLLAQHGVDPAKAADYHWRDLPKRIANTWRRREEDFSQQVKAAMDGCLSCKSCVGQCPIKVDVPAFRARFMQAYYVRYLRPAKDHVVARLEAALPLMSRMPGLVNALSGGISKRLGFVALPALSCIDLRSECSRLGVRTATSEALAGLVPQERARAVVIVQDAFVTHYEPRLLLDVLELLQRLGFKPWLAPYRPNGKPLHVLGRLREFERVARRNVAMLKPLADSGVALVGIDPSMTLTYRSEYVKALGQGAVPKVWLPQEWLAAREKELPQLRPNSGEKLPLLPHCTERTNAPGATSDWLKVARCLGIEFEIIASGCCGMAGLYGHEAVNRAVSDKIWKLSWESIISRPEGKATMATGFSCRCQSKHMSGTMLNHPLQRLLGVVKADQEIRL